MLSYRPVDQWAELDRRTGGIGRLRRPPAAGLVIHAICVPNPMESAGISAALGTVISFQEHCDLQLFPVWSPMFARYSGR